MLTFEERDDVTIQNPPADKVVLFYTDGALRLKDETGEVSTLATTEGLEAAAEATEPKVYRALLTQSGTTAPTAIVLENTLGGMVVWTYSNSGEYLATLVGAFTVNKTFINGGLGTSDGNDVRFLSALRTSDDVVTLKTIRWHWEDIATQALTKSDDELDNTSFEILVYP